MEKKAERNSGIELVKVIAIFLIVVAHVIQTWESRNEYISAVDYLIDLKHVTTDLQTFAVVILRYSGAFGNSIFFICSAWFLLDSRKANRGKMLVMMLNMWSISIMMLVVTVLVKGGDIHYKLVVKSLFPFLCGANWYVGCYLLFYALHPMLNNCIASLNQAQLLRAATLLGVLYCGCNYVHDSFYSSALILWVAVYFIMAYAKKYLPGLCDSIKINIVFLLLGLTGNFLMVLFTNILGGAYIRFLDGKLLFWMKNCSPFLLLAAFALFNLGRNLHFQNRLINYISSLSLLIYIIHENVLVRTYLRPYLCQRIYEVFGHDYILCIVLLFAAAFFLVSLVVSIIYRQTIQRYIHHITPMLLQRIKNIYKKYESFVFKVH